MFYRLSLNWDFSDLFLMILGWGYEMNGRRVQRYSAIFIRTYQGHIVSTRLIIVNINCDHPAGVVFLLGFSTLKLFCHPPPPAPPFPYCTLWKEITICTPHLREGELCSISFRANYLYEPFGILHGRFIYSPPFTYSFNNLHM